VSNAGSRVSVRLFIERTTFSNQRVRWGAGADQEIIEVAEKSIALSRQTRVTKRSASKIRSWFLPSARCGIRNSPRKCPHNPRSSAVRGGAGHGVGKIMQLRGRREGELKANESTPLSSLG